MSENHKNPFLLPDTMPIPQNDDELQPFSSALEKTWKELEARMDKPEGALTRLTTGLTELDDRIVGLQGGDLMLVGARPVTGKTAFALSIANHLAVRKKIPVGLVSLQLSREQIAERLLAMQSLVNLYKMSKAMLSRHDLKDLMVAMSELQKAPLFLATHWAYGIHSAPEQCQQMVLKNGVEIILVDGLDLARHSSIISNGLEELRELKKIAQELNVPIVVTASMNMDQERPRILNLRCASVADIAISMHQEANFHRHDDDWMAKNAHQLGCVELFVEKNKYGPTAFVGVHLWHNTGALYPYEPC